MSGFLPTAIAGAGRAIVQGARVAAREIRFQMLLTSVTRQQHGAPIDFPVAGQYLMSSERGIYEVGRDSVRMLSAIPAFGIARSGDDIYLATWHERDSLVLVGSWSRLKAGKPCGWREIYRVRTYDEAGRIHQIGVCGESLWIANTTRNMLTKIDRHSGAWRANIAPFRCDYGHPILIDHNHLNGVFAQPAYLLFSAFRINERGALGLIGDGKIRIYPYPNIAIHDCVITGQDLYFTDTSRFWDRGKGGAPVMNSQFVDREYFDEHPAHFVRGVAGHGDEVVFGNSYVGNREERFSGSGELILTRHGKVAHRVSVPCAQIYDLLREDGAHFAQGPAPKSFDEAAALLDSRLGPAETELSLRDALIGERAKKFDSSDIGDVVEYMPHRQCA